MLKQKRDFSNILIVEGADDKHSVIGLMRDHTTWPGVRELWPVWVEVGNSVDQILAAGYLTAEIKASNAKTIGVMLDADLDADGRYRRIQRLCATLFPNLPERMPPAGLVVENGDEKRFGAWIMPDNTSQGDLWKHSCATWCRMSKNPSGSRHVTVWAPLFPVAPNAEKAISRRPTFTHGSLGKIRPVNRRALR